MVRSWILLAVSFFFDAAFSQPGQWLIRAPMPVGRQETAPAVLNGKIYIPAGFTVGGQVTTIVEVFDAATNSWSSIAPVPEPLHHYGLAAANGKLYLLGGYQGNTFTPMNRGYVFLPDSNLWRPVANLPVARGAHMAVEFGGKIFLIGGIIGGLTTTRTDVVIRRSTPGRPSPTCHRRGNIRRQRELIR
jgi:N-acetylneuraminic acid mutarotase